MQKIKYNVVIFGAGIAGLWTLNRLQQLGYSAICLEKNTIGGAQTIASQGVIHAGLKYVIHGKTNSTASYLAAMPKRWKAAIENNGEINLNQTKILSNTQFLWSEGRLLDKVTSFFASKSLSSQVKKLNKAEFPEVLQAKNYHGSVYEIDEMVIDVHSLLCNFNQNCNGSIYQINWDNFKLIKENELCYLKSEQYEIHADLFIFAAGSGNQFLCDATAYDFHPMQERPLHQVIIKQEQLPDFYSVCMGNGIIPPVIITTHQAADGKKVWYLGGNLSTSGVNRSAEDQITFAKSEMKRLLPWINLEQAEWSTLYINRAEPKQSQNFLLPEKEFSELKNNCLLTWPTKLVLAPAISDQVIKILDSKNVTKTKLSKLDLKQAEITKTLWD